MKGCCTIILRPTLTFTFGETRKFLFPSEPALFMLYIKLNTALHILWTVKMANQRHLPELLPTILSDYLAQTQIKERQDHSRG